MGLQRGVVAKKLRETCKQVDMLDDALWNANNVHVPAATLHHAVLGSRPSFSGREAHAVPVRAGSLEVGLLR